MAKTKLLLSFFLTFITTHLNAQNLASSFYEIDYFPREMKEIESFINKTCDDVLIYNFIPSSFELRAKDPVEISLPLNDEFSITFLERDSKALANNVSLHYEYDFPLTWIKPNFEISESLFSLPSIFELAVEYFGFSAYDILPELGKMRKDLRSYEEYIEVQIAYFSELAKDYNINQSIYEGITETIAIENYTISEIDELLVNIFIEELSDEEESTLLTTFFERHILNKFTKEKTLQVLDYIFTREDLVGFIEKEVLQAKVNIQLYQGGYFNFPKKYAELFSENLHSFPIHSIAIQIDFKHKKMKIDFVSKTKVDINLKKASYLGTKVKHKKITTNALSLEVSAEGNVVSIFNASESEYPYIIEIK